MQLRDNGRNGQNGRQKTMPNKRKKCDGGNPNPKPNQTKTEPNSTAWNCNWKLVQSETVSESDAETFGHLYGKWHMQLAIFALRNGPGGLGKTVGQNECHC